MATSKPGAFQDSADFDWGIDKKFLPSASTRFLIMRDVYAKDADQLSEIASANLPPLGFQTPGLLRREIDNSVYGPTFKAVLFQIAERFASYFNMDYYNDIAPQYDDDSWWKPEYTKSTSGTEMMSEMDALRCLVDTSRTAGFARAIKSTVEHLQQQSDEPITAIDAGAGSGILSIILAAYGVEKIAAIELNPTTAQAARLLATDLGLDDRIMFLDDDATTVELPFGNADIFVSETLSSGLTDEPHGKILDHLSQYLAPDAHIIPYAATLEMTLTEQDWSDVNKDLTMYRASNLSLSGMSSQARLEVIFTPGTTLATIEGHVEIQRSQLLPGAFNTFCLASSFTLDSITRATLGHLNVNVKFLGRSTAFKLEGLDPDADRYDVIISYEPGCKKRDLKTHVVDGTTIVVTDKDLPVA